MALKDERLRGGVKRWMTRPGANSWADMVGVVRVRARALIGVDKGVIISVVASGAYAVPMSATASPQRKQEFANFVVELMAGFAPVQARRMFGGFGIFWQGLMFAIILDDKLYIKVDDVSEPQFARRGLSRFQYETKGRTASLRYCEAPPEVYDEPEQMAHWARLGFECAVRQQCKPAKKVVRARPGVQARSDEASLSDLKNLGPQSQAMLAKAGITTEAALRRLGPVMAYARTKEVCPKASLNLLWALEGALTGRDWKAVAETERASLLMALDDVQRHMKR